MYPQILIRRFLRCFFTIFCCSRSCLLSNPLHRTKPKGSRNQNENKPYHHLTSIKKNHWPSQRAARSRMIAQEEQNDNFRISSASRVSIRNNSIKQIKKQKARAKHEFGAPRPYRTISHASRFRPVPVSAFPAQPICLSRQSRDEGPSSQNEHSIAVAVKPILLLDCLLVGFQRQITARERTNQHEQELRGR